MSNSRNRIPQEATRELRRTRRARVLAPLAAAVLLVGLLVALAHASGQGRNKSPKPAPQSQPAKTYAPTREITVDKQTGKVRKPTAAETQELVATLSSMLSRSTEGLTARTLPDGARQVTLEGRLAPVAIARPRADGTMEVRCVTSFDEAAEFLGLVESSSAAQVQ
jgi:energy-converting hydrogenase Eha subunit F